MFLFPSKAACGCSPVPFSPPSPACKNDGMHIACNFVSFVCNLLFSFCFSCFTHPFLPLLCLFFENLLPAIVGEHDFENCINVKSMPKTLLRTSDRTNTLNLGLFMAPGICKIYGKNVYFSLMGPLWKLCLPLCVLPYASRMSILYFRRAFVIILLQSRPTLGSHIAQICKANTAGKICRIYFAIVFSSWIH